MQFRLLFAIASEPEPAPSLIRKDILLGFLEAVEPSHHLGVEIILLVRGRGSSRGRGRGRGCLGRERGRGSARRRGPRGGGGGGVVPVRVPPLPQRHQLLLRLCDVWGEEDDVFEERRTRTSKVERRCIEARVPRA